MAAELFREREEGAGAGLAGGEGGSSPAAGVSPIDSRSDETLYLQ